MSSSLPLTAADIHTLFKMHTVAESSSIRLRQEDCQVKATVLKERTVPQEMGKWPVQSLFK